MVPQKLINLVAAMTPAHPDEPILEFQAPQEETWVEDEVPLDPSGRYVGQVVYSFPVQVSGRHQPATHIDPASYPDIQVGPLSNMRLDGPAIDMVEQDEVQAPPGWENVASKYFYNNLEPKIQQRLTEKSSSRSRYSGRREDY